MVAIVTEVVQMNRNVMKLWPGCSSCRGDCAKLTCVLIISNPGPVISVNTDHNNNAIITSRVSLVPPSAYYIIISFTTYDSIYCSLDWKDLVWFNCWLGLLAARMFPLPQWGECVRNVSVSDPADPAVTTNPPCPHLTLPANSLLSWHPQCQHVQSVVLLVLVMLVHRSLRSV